MTETANSSVLPDAEKAMTEPTSKESWETYRRLLRYVKPDWFIFLIAVIGFQIGNAAEAYFVAMFGDLIDSWPTTALMVPVMMFVAAMGRGIGEIIGELLLSRISFNVVHTLRTQLFDQFLNLPSAFFDASSQGYLVSRITFNVAQLRGPLAVVVIDALHASRTTCRAAGFRQSRESWDCSTRSNRTSAC